MDIIANGSVAYEQAEAARPAVGVHTRVPNSPTSGSSSCSINSTADLDGLQQISCQLSSVLDLSAVQNEEGQPDLTELELGPLLGAGAFGRVHRAAWRGSPVAVKVMETTQQLIGMEGEAQGPLLEAVLSTALSHPNIVRTDDFSVHIRMVDDADGQQTTVQQVWIVQQYCDQGTLANCLNNGWLRESRQPRGSLNAVAILQTAQEVASAMTYLHFTNLVHGDLSSQNVLLNSSPKDYRGFTALVSDFGLTRLEKDTQVGHTYGTVSYMPPELLSNGQVSKALDVYSFGVLLWEMWAGSQAWAGCPAHQVMHMVAKGTAQLPAQTDAPAAYQSLTKRCLRFEPNQRPDFSQVLQEVSQMLEAELAAALATECGTQGGYIHPRHGSSTVRTPSRAMAQCTTRSITFGETPRCGGLDLLQKSPFACTWPAGSADNA